MILDARSAVNIPRQSRGLSFMSRSKRLKGVANAAPTVGNHLMIFQFLIRYDSQGLIPDYLFEDHKVVQGGR